MYDFKVKWCPICNQGWVQIVKEKETGNLFLCCEECESEWNNPEQILGEKATRDVYGYIEDPTMDEVKEKKWDSYLN